MIKESIILQKKRGEQSDRQLANMKRCRELCVTSSFLFRSSPLGRTFPQIVSGAERQKTSEYPCDLVNTFIHPKLLLLLTKKRKKNAEMPVFYVYLFQNMNECQSCHDHFVSHMGQTERIKTLEKEKHSYHWRRGGSQIIQARRTWKEIIERTESCKNNGDIGSNYIYHFNTYLFLSWLWHGWFHTSHFNFIANMFSLYHFTSLQWGNTSNRWCWTLWTIRETLSSTCGRSPLLSSAETYKS